MCRSVQYHFWHLLTSALVSQKLCNLLQCGYSHIWILFSTGTNHIILRYQVVKHLVREQTYWGRSRRRRTDHETHGMCNRPAYTYRQIHTTCLIITTHTHTHTHTNRYLLPDPVTHTSGTESLKTVLNFSSAWGYITPLEYSNFMPTKKKRGKDKTKATTANRLLF